MSLVGVDSEPLLDFASSDTRTGFRLERLEVLNWGTFHDRVWTLAPAGANTLLTGDIGSGKSTLVDAITTLLVPPQKLAYNKAAGAELRERSPRSYVLGYYKTERSDASLSVRPVPLRDANTYSVLLGVFHNSGFDQDVTLAQVFWLKDPESQPARFFVVADRVLSIAEHFSAFGTELADLRKRLRKLPRVEVFDDGYPQYGAALRRRFGIENEQALELFNQTVSMKSVGNLTDFVRQHMLEPFGEDERVRALIAHYDDLNRAHEAVLHAKAQIAGLEPIAADLQRFGGLVAEDRGLRASRDGLGAYFAGLKAELLGRRIAHLEADLERAGARIVSRQEERRREGLERDEFKQAIVANGGDRLERLKAAISDKRDEKAARGKRAEQYEVLARKAGLEPATDAEGFALGRRSLEGAASEAQDREVRAQNERTEAEVAFRVLRDQHDELAAEVVSLRQRRSNVPSSMLRLRATLCEAAGLGPDTLPFVGELLQVRDEERAWEGAIERVLHGFGMSLLVPDELYPQVAEAADRTHLGGRLVYFRVKPRVSTAHVVAGPASLVRKVSIKPDSEHYGWLEAELARRFDYTCCDTLDQFRREKQALTRAGQIRGGERHEKDDRFRIDDRSRFVLGWSNEAKLASLEAELGSLEQRVQATAARLGVLQHEQVAARDRLALIAQLRVYDSWRDLDWRPLVVEIDGLERELRELEQASDVLRTLEQQLASLEEAIRATDAALEDERRARDVATHKRDQSVDELHACQGRVAAVPPEVRERERARLDELRARALGEHTLTVESCDNRERELRDWIQQEIDALGKKLDRLRDKIVGAIQAFRNQYPAETREIDASVDAGPELAALLTRLRDDDLPRFEARFKELLNENTIREVANFQSQLHRERQTIKERIDHINDSLRAIDYNPGRYIQLETHATGDVEIRDFQADLRACTEGALTGSDEAEYSEAKFLLVRRLIERFRGREERAELDRRWTRKVTDVRNWFTFSASERWREDGREHEHYADSGGKSGGQKEKLAYTVLAASLAYQFGLEHGAKRSRSFRFVVIDEAFGRGSDESARYALNLFGEMNLQLLIATPLQKIHVIEPFVSSVGFVHNEDGRISKLRCLTIEEYRAERARRSGASS